MQTRPAGRSASAAALKPPGGRRAATSAVQAAPPPRALALPVSISLALHAAAVLLIAAHPPRQAAIGPAQPVIAVLSLIPGRADPWFAPTFQRLADSPTRVQASRTTPVATGIVDASLAPLPQLAQPPTPPPAPDRTAAVETAPPNDADPDPAAVESRPGRSDFTGPSTRPLWRSTEVEALAAQAHSALSAQAQAAQVELARRQAQAGQRASYEAVLQSLVALHPGLGECTVDIAAALAPTAACSDVAATTFLQTQIDQIGAAPPIADRWQVQLATAPSIGR
jgi:hypothetical protein